MDKQFKRQRRARKTRAKIKELQAYRLTVNRSLQHIRAQVISCGGEVIAAASTLEKDARTDLPRGSNQEAAKWVGKKIAERCISKGIKKVSFDRSGFKFHGRVKALADSAREEGIEF